MTHHLLIATHNPGKVREYRALLADLPLDLVYLDDLGITDEVEETGATFEENALLKARYYASRTGLWTWADDSGLEVDALGGRPGVHSARYAGPDASDADRYRKLLVELQGHPRPWTARFRCAVALVRPDGVEAVCHGTLEGEITDTPRGSHGFGYDPVFYLPERGQTLAELPPEEKNRISHRARAAQTAREVLRGWLNVADAGDAPAP